MARCSSLLALVLTVVGTVAHADKTAAKDKYEAAERAYNLGQFKKAIELYTAAYEELPEPAFLFNIAQSYRMAGDCKQALFFYRRFLSTKEADKAKPLKPEIRTEVEGRIADLEECVKREIASKPPQAVDNGTTTSTSAPTSAPTTTAPNLRVATTAGDIHTDDKKPDVVAHAQVRPKIVSVRITGGAAKLNAGNLDTPTTPAFALVAGYPLALGPKLELDLGPAASFTPIAYGTTSSGDGTATIFSVLANAGVAYTVAPKIAVRCDLGVGVQILAGLGKPGNPLTMGAVATGALTSVAARVALSVDYAVTKSVVVTATPFAVSYSPAPSGLLSSISSLTTLAFLVGIGYRQ